jgi:hypothetical protein
MGGQQGIASDLWSHLTVAQDEVRQDGEDRFARGALETPDRETAQADPGIMGMARQAPTTAVTGCLVCELEAESEEKGEDDLEERLGVAQELSVGRFIVEIDSDGTVVPRPCDAVSNVSPPDHQVSSADETRWG